MSSMPVTASRALVALSLLVGFLSAPPAGARPATMTLLDLSVSTSRKAPLDTAWVRERLESLHLGLDVACHEPALVKTPHARGEVTIKARLGANGRLTGVTVTRARGHSLPYAMVTCIQRQLARVRVDMSPLGHPSRGPDTAGGPGLTNDPPGRSDLPLRLVLELAFTPPHGLPRPDPGTSRCGPSPAGCKATGCPDGLVCETAGSCRPSSCSCNPETGHWMCTRDCGGGMCVPAPRPAPAPTPPGSTDRPPSLDFCEADSDCATTCDIPGNCCAGQCSTSCAYAVNRFFLGELAEQRRQSCQSKRCPAVACALDRTQHGAVCRQGRCQAVKLGF